MMSKYPERIIDPIVTAYMKNMKNKNDLTLEEGIINLLDAIPILALVEAMRRIQTDTSSATYPAPDCVARVKIIADEALAAWGTE